MHSISVLEYMLCSLVVLILVTLYLGYKAELLTFLDRLVFVATAFMLVHVAHILVCQMAFPGKRYLDWAAPFGLMYGPFFYWSSYSYNGRPFRLSTAFWHALPFLIGLVGYAFIAVSGNFSVDFLLKYGRVLYSCICCSFVAYAVKGLMEKQDRKSWSEEKRLVTIAGSVIFVAAIYFFIVSFASPPAGTARNYLYIRTGVYLIMLTMVAFMLRYNVNRLMQHGLQKESAPLQPHNPGIDGGAHPGETDDHLLHSHNQQKSEDDGEVNEAGLPYQKSLLPAELLDEYENKLNLLFREKKNYLDPDLSLQVLAKELKIPKHHLTQLFSIRIGKNFYQYINVFRVEHACELIGKSESGTLETLAFESGFNSKTTFNRYFKAQMGCTPSEYRDQQLQR
ncbi:helix-turn-helix domain-containing protein [Filimonas effusa]|uniref:AraC family transcriptional regulator n=1 Tax=Filimonas effusa TaxID=2508721 RepID=A0A4Q1D6C0_9BACT|nr:helix-turn-helix domain-containing protein [Filimonas effusa]RXK83516.1 AraC family transcriptional regulator [Filimonas effusa]